MMKLLLMLMLLLMCALPVCAQDMMQETEPQRDARMKWWRDARFGLFIHWGLYAIPAGEWNGQTTYGEWIRNQAQIPLVEYENFVKQFNPAKFDAELWVKTAKEAGMKYIVITSKHHDGFCLFDSRYTEFDIMSTPFERDILKELSAACQKEGIRLCFYYSIMDWHHPDYSPRRSWETARSAERAEFERYIQYMKNQLKELVTNYGPIGVLWFDGEWENTWSDERGKELYHYLHGLQPDIIINNRVSASRAGMEGFTSEGGFAGDFGTPEQQIPATGLPGTDWESCMTINDHWGYNKHDNNFKLTKEILHMLADIASKGGNYLLNVGPTAEGVFPPASIKILDEIGQWMKVNGEAIYKTKASPFRSLDWGRCTQKNTDENTRLYLHVFNWPGDGNLIIPGIYNNPLQAYLLADTKKAPLTCEKSEDSIIIAVPPAAPDSINSVVVLDIRGRADVNNPPEFEYENVIFIDSIIIKLKSDRENVDIRYTTDNKIPDINSFIATGPVHIKMTSVISARCFRDRKPVSGTVRKTFTKVKPLTSIISHNPATGIRYRYFEGDWDQLPDFNSLQSVNEGIMANFLSVPATSADQFGFEYKGYIKVPVDGVYTFYTASDDGSRLYIGEKLIVDNDGLHGIEEKSGKIALAKGYHPIRVIYFEKSGGENLSVLFKGPGVEKNLVPDSLLFWENR